MAPENENHSKANDFSIKKDIFEPGDIVDKRYRVERRIAAGGMGTVYRVVHLQTNCPMALKVLHPDRALDRDARRLFEQELQIGSIIKPNPHLVQVCDAGLDAQRGVRYLVMNYIDGVTVEEYITNWGPLPPEVAMALAVQCARAMKQVHQAGVVHRDLKPSNIFITVTDEGEPHAMISDFGIAKVSQGPTYGFVTPVCTPAYAPPELLLASVPAMERLGRYSALLPITPATDVYSFGLILYEMLSGARPGSLLLDHTEATRKGSTIPIPPETPECTISQACARSPQLPDGSADWLKKCLQFNPADRWQSLEDAVNELAKLFAADNRFPNMNARVKYVIIPKTEAQPRPKRRVRTLILPKSAAAPSSAGDGKASERAHANGKTTSRIAARVPLLVACTAVVVAILAIFTTRLTTKEATNAFGTPSTTAFATIMSLLTKSQQSATLHFQSNAGCMLLVDGKPGGYAPLNDILIDTARPHDISIKCEPNIFGFCALHMKPGETKTIEINHPNEQFDAAHKLEDDCARWFK